MLKKIALGLVGLVVLLVVVIALQPAAFTIQRSATIQAPADVVYGHIQDLRAQDAWSPWTKMDPKLTITYSEPPSGVGATSAWEGPEMGKGRLTVVAVKPNQQVDLKLEMLEPMAATNRVVFTLVPEGDATTVTWRMDGSNSFVGKAFSLVMDMDEMVGGEFEKGLAALKTLAQTETANRRAAL